MNRQNGITMIMMVITVVMMALIAAFSIYNSKETIVETKITKAYNEIREVKDAVMRYAMLNLEMSDLRGCLVSNPANYGSVLDSYYPSYENHVFYFLNFKEQKNVLEDILELRNVENNYIIDATDLSNLKVYLVNGIQIEDRMYYMDTEIIEKYNGIFSGR